MESLKRKRKRKKVNGEVTRLVGEGFFFFNFWWVKLVGGLVVGLRVGCGPKRKKETERDYVFNSI